MMMNECVSRQVKYSFKNTTYPPTRYCPVIASFYNLNMKNSIHEQKGVTISERFGWKSQEKWTYNVDTLYIQIIFKYLLCTWATI